MTKAHKNRIPHPVLISSLLLPVLLSGCATVDRLTESDDDFLDYTTDRRPEAAIQPPAAAPAAIVQAPPIQQPVAQQSRPLQAQAAPVQRELPPVAQAPTEPVMATALPTMDAINDTPPKFNIYAAAGTGVSQLEPDTSGATGISVGEKNSTAGQISLGMDINKHIALELHATTLGQAELAPAGEISYALGGISALYYAGKNRHNAKRRGLSGFGRVGVSMLHNDTEGDITYKRENDAQMHFGTGLEFNTRRGLGLRAEVIAFDRDAKMAQLGLIYRFDKKQPTDFMADKPMQKAEPVALAAPAPAPEPVPMIKPELVLAAATAPKDNDQDGVADTDDLCPSTGLHLTVDRRGCAIFSGTLQGLNFPTNSAMLTNIATTLLNDVSNTLQQYPDANILVTAHTDSHGSDENNQTLSERRARAVVDYLAQKGIPYSRMAAKAYGERKPIDTNNTTVGRANNRRVELFATQRALR